MNIRNLIGVAAVAVALVAGGTYAFSEDAPAPAAVCRIAPLSALEGIAADSETSISKVSQGEIDKLTEGKGLPPGAEGKPFTVERIDNNGMTMLIVIQGDCINDKVGPVPSQMIDNVLGSVKASG